MAPVLAEASRIQSSIKRAHQESEGALRGFVDESLPPPLRNRLRLRLEVETGAPSELILQTSRARDTQLIVMGTHGRRGSERILLGSTAEQVLHFAERPVLSVPRGASLHGDDLDGRLKKILVATDFGRSATAAVQWAIDIALEMDVPLVFAHVVEPVW